MTIPETRHLSGIVASHSEEVFQQLPEDVQQHMSADLSGRHPDHQRMHL
jgi:hypothetical protein